jgi:hypothetical protein
MLDRDDVIRITENILRGLSLEVERSNFTNPNVRCIVLKHNERELSKVYFDVVQQREYEG